MCKNCDEEITENLHDQKIEQQKNKKEPIQELDQMEQYDLYSGTSGIFGDDWGI